MDDFELCFPDHSIAEATLAALQETLLEYELRLNPRKTIVERTPMGFEPEWIHELRDFEFSTNPRGQATDLVRYFDYVTAYFHAAPREHVVKYALARIRALPVLVPNWDLYQSLLVQAVTAEPGAISAYIDALMNCQSPRACD